jgi:hypothetical protein
MFAFQETRVDVFVQGKWPREQPSVTGIPGLPTPRLGAFEVQMAVWQMGEQHPNVYILHSKLFTYRWPQMMAVVKAIAERLPAKQLEVTVQVFDYEDGAPKEIPAPEGKARVPHHLPRAHSAHLLFDSRPRTWNTSSRTHTRTQGFC